MLCQSDRHDDDDGWNKVGVPQFLASPAPLYRKFEIYLDLDGNICTPHIFNLLI